MSRARLPEGVRMLYGIGAQKAGTSWLHAQLARAPEVHMPPVKEVHYFDVRAGVADPARALRVDQLRRLAGALPDRPGPTDRRTLRDLRRTAELLEIYTGDDSDDHAPYVAYLTRGWTGAPVICDITPAYAILDRGHFLRMDAIGDARFLFILRDPVARMWSQIRMACAAEGARGPALAEACLARAMTLLRTNRLPGLGRADYARTLRELEAAVPRQRILTLFYENLVDPAQTRSQLDRLAAFLSIPPLPEPGGSAINPGPPVPLSGPLRDELRAALAPQYAAMRDRFGAALPEAWI